MLKPDFEVSNQCTYLSRSQINNFGFTSVFSSVHFVTAMDLGPLLLHHTISLVFSKDSLVNFIKRVHLMSCTIIITTNNCILENSTHEKNMKNDKHSMTMTDYLIIFCHVLATCCLCNLHVFQTFMHLIV